MPSNQPVSSSQSDPDPSQRNPATRALFVNGAQARGLDASFVLGRLLNSSFVSHRHRYLYIETPKAACTKLKHFIAEIEEAPVDLKRQLYLRETRIPMLIHQRAYIGVPTLLDIHPEEIPDLIAGRLGYMAFALVRNPYSRLVSAFESKIRLHEPGFAEAGRRWGALEIGADVRAAFADFIREAVPYFARAVGEHHFIPQRELLLPDLITYSRFFPVERFDEFEDAFFSHLRGNGVTGKLAFQERNRSLYPNWRYYYDEPTARIVADFYKKDFEAFGYDFESWRLGGETPELRTSAEDAHWRKAIIERNEMICFLYERLK